MTLDDYLRPTFEADVRHRIAERRLRRTEWRLWWRYLRGGRAETLGALAILTALNDAMEADLRFLRRVTAWPDNAGVAFVERLFVRP